MMCIRKGNYVRGKKMKKEFHCLGSTESPKVDLTNSRIGKGRVQRQIFLTVSDLAMVVVVVVDVKRQLLYM